MSTTRARPLAPVSASSSANALSCALPSLPVAIKGPVGTPELKPMIADLPANAKVGEDRRAARLVACGPGRKRRLEKRHGRAHVGVVIAGNEADVGRVAERPHPQRRAAELGRHADIDEIAGDGDMIGALRAQIRDEPRQQGHVVEPLASPLPVDEPHDALQPQIGEAGHRRGAQVRVGDVRDRKAHP